MFANARPQGCDGTQGPISFFHSKLSFCRSVVTGLVWGALLASLHAVELTCPLPDEGGIYQSSDGVIDLHWGDDGASGFELEQSSGAVPGDFKPRYQGTDQSSVRSGLAPGLHHFRVRATDAGSSTWSDTLSVRVTYMEEGRLRLLLALGGFVVLATVTTILHGHFSHKKREERP